MDVYQSSGVYDRTSQSGASQNNLNLAFGSLLDYPVWPFTKR